MSSKTVTVTRMYQVWVSVCLKKATKKVLFFIGRAIKEKNNLFSNFFFPIAKVPIAIKALMARPLKQEPFLLYIPFDISGEALILWFVWLA